MAPKRLDLIHSIADTIKDYREGEIDPINANHVSHWINQFDYPDTLTILMEMDSILKRFYLSRKEVKQRLYDLLSFHIPNESPAQVLARAHFLNIQKRGGSQRALLDIIDEVLQERYAIKLAQCGAVSPTSYIYVDDAIYTGNRLRYDLTEGEDAVAWIPRLAPSNCKKLFILSLAAHTAGLSYAREHIERAAEAKQIKVFYTCIETIENERNQGAKFECLWPDRSTADGDDPDAGWYVKRLLWWCNQKGLSKSSLTRSPGMPAEETLFSSPIARNIVESAFFRAGARILKPSHQPGEHRRPLGWEILESWGFGTFFVTYRNIANNCPMVLWSKAAGWYPLFPRKLNTETDGYDD